MKINGSAFGDTPPTDEKEIEKIQRKSDAAEVVIMVKGIALFESNHYKTVIGALHFSEQPWQ